MKTVKKIRQIITTLVYSANAPAQLLQKQFYMLPGQVDGFPGQPLQLFCQAKLLYKSSTEQFEQPLQLFWQAKLLLIFATGAIWQPKEAIYSKKELQEAPDLLQIFNYIHKKASGEAYNEVAELCIAVCRQLLRPQGCTTQQCRLGCCRSAQCRLHANYNASLYTHCRPP